MATGTYVDTRDGNSYGWKTIGANKWMIENFRYLPYVNNVEDITGDIWVYGYDGEDETQAVLTSNYSTYGALYSNQAAIDLCPDGCRLPTDAEYMDLESALGMYYFETGLFFWRSTDVEGSKLKSDTGWILDYNGTDTSGFTALPGGYRGTSVFDGLGYKSLFWTSSSMQGDKNAFMRMLSIKQDGVYRLIWPVECGLSVRYIVN
jgi:uncharacterized protein (TIGR02145 family)